jgi:hypothetical protein
MQNRRDKSGPYHTRNELQDGCDQLFYGMAINNCNMGARYRTRFTIYDWDAIQTRFIAMGRGLMMLSGS